MLLGEYEHTIDDKNRLTLPAKFRSAFSGGIVVTRGMDGCLSAYAPDAWERVLQGRLASLDPLSKEGRRMQRFFYSGATEGELDKQGRVNVPAALIDHAGVLPATRREWGLAPRRSSPLLEADAPAQPSLRAAPAHAADAPRAGCVRRRRPRARRGSRRRPTEAVRLCRS